LLGLRHGPLQLPQLPLAQGLKVGLQLGLGLLLLLAINLGLANPSRDLLCWASVKAWA
jgi:hypothetical protein